MPFKHSSLSLELPPAALLLLFPAKSRTLELKAALDRWWNCFSCRCLCWEEEEEEVAGCVCVKVVSYLLGLEGEVPKEQMTELKRRHSIELGSHMYSSASLKTPKTDTTLSPSIRERKDKLGEKISALQQLVSPFGKTDTASVLLEATEYIKFLQDQVQVLSAPYLHGASKLQGPETQNLRSRGLCVVPVECSLKVAHSNGADIWAPTMGSSKSESSSRR